MINLACYDEIMMKTAMKFLIMKMKFSFSMCTNLICSPNFTLELG